MTDTDRVLFVSLKEKVLAQGAESLTDTELLTLLISFSSVSDASGYADRLLAAYGSFRSVLSLSEKELLSFGLPRTVSAFLSAVQTAYGRILLSEISDAQVFDTADRIADYLIRVYAGIHVETVFLLLLDDRYRLIDCVKMTEGVVNSANLNVRRLVETALFRSASMVVVAHNHPGGAARPSQADIDTTVRLKAAFESVGISMIEHMIIAGDRYVPLLLGVEGMCREDSETFYRSAPASDSEDP